MANDKGFTLIELILVIVILGIIAITAAPKFINLQQDAKRAAFSTIAAAFKAGVKQVHLAWLIRGNGQEVQNFLPITDPIAGGDLSVNSAGYPADTRGYSRTLNSRRDCNDVWRAVLDSQAALVAKDDSVDFTAVYNGGNTCTYTYVDIPEFTVSYDSNSGEVIINN